MGPATRQLAVALLAIPLLVGTGRVVAVAVGESLGPIPEDRVPVNIAEAAGLANAGEVVRRMRQGEDPGRILPVRAHVISSAIPLATAFEAAVWARRVELVALFDDEGAPLDEATRAELACLAADIEAEDIYEYLTRESAPACEQGAAVKRIEARRPPPTS